MANVINKIKSIHWPTKRETLCDTVFTLVVVTVLSTLTLAWVSGIEFVINWIVSLF